MIFNTNGLIFTAVVAQQFPQLLGGRCFLAVSPDTNIGDNRRYPGLNTISRPSQECHTAINTKVHGLKHRVTTGIVTTQVVHALLTKENHAVQTLLIQSAYCSIQATIIFAAWKLKVCHRYTLHHRCSATCLSLDHV